VQQAGAEKNRKLGPVSRRTGGRGQNFRSKQKVNGLNGDGALSVKVELITYEGDWNNKELASCGHHDRNPPNAKTRPDPLDQRRR